jgi:hypothetical protein
MENPRNLTTDIEGEKRNKNEVYRVASVRAGLDICRKHGKKITSSQTPQAGI